MQLNLSDQIFKIGARGSPLSLAQTGQLRAILGAAHGLLPDRLDYSLPIVAITTTGDRIQDRALSEAGGKGLFTRELDDALLEGRIDCAIHSLKDVPTQMPDGIVLLGGPKREDRRDALITTGGLRLDQLKEGAIVGSASLRRGAQLLHARPDLQIVMLRGNVGTRLAKLQSGVIDATLLAAAGLARLGLLDQVAHTFLSPDDMPPAIGQGALAITVRAGDSRAIAAFAAIIDETCAIEIAAERAFLTALDGSCRTAIGALAVLSPNGDLSFKGEALSENGGLRWRHDAHLAHASLERALALGTQAGQVIKAKAGNQLAGAG